MCWRPLVLVRSRNHDGLDHDFMSNPPLGSQASPPPRNNTSLWRFSQELGECAKYLKAARVHHAAGYMVRCSKVVLAECLSPNLCAMLGFLCRWSRLGMRRVYGEKRFEVVTSPSTSEAS